MSEVMAEALTNLKAGPRKSAQVRTERAEINQLLIQLTKNLVPGFDKSLTDNETLMWLARWWTTNLPKLIEDGYLEHQ